MSLNRMMRKIDNLICRYFGLRKEIMRPVFVNLRKNRVTLSYTLSHKRHLIEEPWNNLNIDELKNMDPAFLEQVGLATGRVLADNLVVTFEPLIIRELDHA